MPMTIGTQPPFSILITLAENSVRSMMRKTAVIGTTWASDQFQRPRATT